jgi:hypothetical protein
VLHGFWRGRRRRAGAWEEENVRNRNHRHHLLLHLLLPHHHLLFLLLRLRSGVASARTASKTVTYVRTGHVTYVMIATSA